MTKEEMAKIEQAEQEFNTLLLRWQNPRQHPDADLNALETARQRLVDLLTKPEEQRG